MKVFKDLDKWKEGNIIIDCETERLTGILKEVKSFSVCVLVGILNEGVCQSCAMIVKFRKLAYCFQKVLQMRT